MKPKAKAPRKRRDPEEAKSAILDAAERVLSEHAPDAVGLVEIAREAGVSHALVSHYFGTYGGLVDGVLERRRASVRARVLARVAEAKSLDADELLDTLFDALSDASFVRLTVWAISQQRASASFSFPIPAQGLRILAETLATRLGDERATTRTKIEHALVIACSSAYGYVVAREAWMGALGRKATPTFDRALRRSLGEMIRGFVGDVG